MIVALLQQPRHHTPNEPMGITSVCGVRQDVSVGGQHKRQHPYQLCFAPAAHTWHLLMAMSHGMYVGGSVTCVYSPRGVGWGGAGTGGVGFWGGAAACNWL